MKEKIKKIPIIGKIITILKKNIDSLEFYKDKHFFLKNYMYNENTLNKICYSLIFEVHKLEKGMTSNDLRPFGKDKVKKIIDLIKKNQNLNKNIFSYNLSINCLYKYKEIYEKYKWTDRSEYIIVKEFLKNKNDYNYLKVGAYDLARNDIMKDANIDYLNFLKSRHSIRNFSDKKLLLNDINKAVEMAILSPSACNRQMVKCYYIGNEENKKIITKYAQGLSLFNLSGINYFIITFDVNSNYFIGERNQGWFNAGLFSMNFINALHSLGIGSCCIQFGNSFNQEKKIKSILKIPSNERIAIIIAAGYYDTISKVTYSSRKNIDNIFKIL